MKKILIPVWLFGVMLTITVLSLMYALGVFQSKQVKKLHNERDSIRNYQKQVESNRDKSIVTASADSEKSEDTANQLIKTLPNEKYTTPRDTTDDYMWRKITE